ncbi:hypothetical protein D3C87_1799910 [compost metagenome]
MKLGSYNLFGKSDGHYAAFQVNMRAFFFQGQHFGFCAGKQIIVRIGYLPVAAIHCKEGVWQTIKQGIIFTFFC